LHQHLDEMGLAELTVYLLMEDGLGFLCGCCGGRRAAQWAEQVQVPV